jgi:hypothetical protein
MTFFVSCVIITHGDEPPLGLFWLNLLSGSSPSLAKSPYFGLNLGN